jgi:hypothetical protein
VAAALPKAFRQTMKLGLETTRRGFETLMTANEAAWKAEKRLPSSQGGIAVLVQEMTKLTRSNVDANLRVAEKLTDAESAEQAFGLYVEYMQERMTAFMGQWQEIGNLCARLAETPNGTETPDRAEMPDAGETPAPSEPAAPPLSNQGSSSEPSFGKQADRTTNGSGTHKPQKTRKQVRATQTKAPGPAASSAAASDRTAKSATPAHSTSPAQGSSKPKDRSSKAGRKAQPRSRKSP